MADIDWGFFAHEFRRRLGELGLSQKRAAQAWPAANEAMISRAINGAALKPGALLLLCSLTSLDPMLFMIVVKQRRVTRASIRKSLSRQADTVGVPRETGEVP